MVQTSLWVFVVKLQDLHKIKTWTVHYLSSQVLESSGSNTYNDAQQKIYLNGNDCGTKNEGGPFNYNNPLSELDGTGSSYTNGAIDELKFFNQVLEIGEVKKLLSILVEV